MIVAFLDESGELGFSAKSSKNFVIAILACKHTNVNRLRGISKRIRQRKLKKQFKQLPELKANNTSIEIRELVLRKIMELDVEIYTIILNKSKVYDYLKEKKHKIYNYVSNLILSECSVTDGKIELIVDRRGGNVLTKEFNDYIRAKFKEREKECNIDISHDDSKNDGGLQMVDFVSWAIFRKYEFNDLHFYDLIKDKITIEKKWLWTLEGQ